VESLEADAGIADFSSLDEVPKEIFDQYSERQIPVTSKNIRVLFKANPMTR